jgi:peptide/nickel transport system permease protein
LRLSIEGPPEGQETALFSFALRRTLFAIPLLIGVATLVFFVLSLAPGDPGSLYLHAGMSPETQEQIRQNLGLGDPLWVQYGRWIMGFLQGDFQISLDKAVPVRQLIRAALPNSIVLGGGALVLSFFFGIALGVVQAVRQNSATDSLLSGITLFFYSAPSFWLAMLVMFLFTTGGLEFWGWSLGFPVSGAISPDYEFLGTWGQVEDRVHHLVLPMLTLTLVLTGGVARYVRASMLEVLKQDYIRTARAKGLSEASVILRHGLRNALLPVVTLFGMYLPLLLSGTVFIEWVFDIPGMGTLLVNAAMSGDHPVVMAVGFLFGVAVILGNLVADLLYGVVDPRIRQGNG